MGKNCSTCEAYKEEKYQEFDKDGNLVLDEIGKCKRFNFVFETSGWLPENMICNYHRKPSKNEKLKLTPEDYLKTKHAIRFRSVAETKE